MTLLKSRAQVVIIIGFDRCGSSMIAGLLAKHPNVNMFFQPFNSTEIHKTQWEIWPPEREAPRTEAFLKGLLNGFLDTNYIASDWFYNYSTSKTVVPQKINLIKDTKFHFKINWLNHRFPNIMVYGIWRDPRAIVCSLMRNDFYRKWYGEKSFKAIRDLIKKESLIHVYLPFMNQSLSDFEKMALIVAVRTHMMSLYIDSKSWLIYEYIVSDANAVLNPFVKELGLNEFDFSSHTDHDFNIIGLPFEKVELWRDYFSQEEINRLNEIFTILDFPLNPYSPPEHN